MSQKCLAGYGGVWTMQIALLREKSAVSREKGAVDYVLISVELAMWVFVILSCCDEHYAPRHAFWHAAVKCLVLALPVARRVYIVEALKTA